MNQEQNQKWFIWYIYKETTFNCIYMYTYIVLQKLDIVVADAKKSVSKEI